VERWDASFPLLRLIRSLRLSGQTVTEKPRRDFDRSRARDDRRSSQRTTRERRRRRDGVARFGEGKASKLYREENADVEFERRANLQNPGAIDIDTTPRYQVLFDVHFPRSLKRLL